MNENKNPVLSVVVPAYNEGPALAEAAGQFRLALEASDIAYELIFVDDGSEDDTWTQIMGLAREDERVAGVKLSKNFGKEGAILAGLAHARGKACALIDCDLQHPPEMLAQMYHIWRAGGTDIVEGIKNSRGKEPILYTFFSNLFYFLIGRTGNVQLKNASDFQLLDRRVVDIIINLPERQRFFRALSSWVGFNRKQVRYDVKPRLSGKSKFTGIRSTQYALNNIASFSSAPLQVVTITGVIFLLFFLGLGIHTFARWLTGTAVEGFTTVILLLLIIGAMLMISLGVIGFYVGKIYEELKGRPAYLVEDRVNVQGE
ncbi:MAG: glycosyltransferase [Defluviitaleaceae bacterium]|nr:glycosyltransferase [Defluviitaleaceae bacterium]MCL2240851.1 glycosyltransferase [Defluviitaleaceae bacterium]